MNKKIKNRIGISLLLAGLLGLCSCSSPSSNSAETFVKETVREETIIEETKAQTSGLAYEGSMELQYAENFGIDYYEGGYTMLTTRRDGCRFLLIPEGSEVPEGLDDDVVILKQPVSDIYLVASAVMDMFCELDGLEAIAFS